MTWSIGLRQCNTYLWERLSGLGGTFSEIITIGSSDGQQYVTISPSDAGFFTDGCGTWTPVRR